MVEYFSDSVISVIIARLNTDFTVRFLDPLDRTATVTE